MLAAAMPHLFFGELVATLGDGRAAIVHAPRGVGKEVVGDGVFCWHGESLQHDGKPARGHCSARKPYSE